MIRKESLIFLKFVASSVTLKDTSCTIRLLAKFEFLARASNKTRLESHEKIEIR